ncbi:hypothetical protein BDBG_01303 [Blastomyces gilchristii SLH14081]|uniref:Rhodopsin domain-containing protein n=1 Tax=Blastomyces gilchristii (strain SLH14081) TaxID=559298 RepID=A0A179UCB9_BLAGS|nr:uncharacterized protein BDBG_01303 [Blastomyces gilchristii SLH14081]OAT04807.1 hypothetical protein BDBG_01303 [Blastomyces gilchristii SLH14081]
MSLPPPSDPAAAAAAAAAEAAFHSFSTEAWTLLAVAILVTGIRTYARVTAVGFKGLQPDDYLVLVGATFYTIETALAYSVGNVAKGLANNGMTDEQRAALSPGSPEHRLRVIGSKIQICGWTSYGILLWSLKASLLVLYMRLTLGLNRSYRIRIYIGFGFIVASWVAVVLNLFLACRPFHKNWQIYPDPGNVCQPAISNQIIWVFLGLNVTTDMYLLSIPIPMLWQSSIKPLKKVGLTVLFSGGLLVMACAVLRVVMIVIDPVNGAQSAGSWAVRETFVAVVTTNLPMIFPLMKRWLSSVFGSLITSMRSSKRTGNETPKDLRNFGGSSGFNSSNRRGRGPPTANPIPNTTFSESEERIIEEYNMQEMKNNKNRSTNGNADSTQRYNGNDNKIQKRIDFTVVSEDGSSDGQRASPGNHDNGRLHNGFDFSGGAATSGFRTGDRANTRNF